MCLKDEYMSYNTHACNRVKWKMILQTSKEHIIKSAGYNLKLVYKAK